MKEESEGDGTSNDVPTSRDADSTVSNGSNGPVSVVGSQARRLLPDVSRSQVMGATLAALGVEVASSAMATTTTDDHGGLPLGGTLANALLGITIDVNRGSNNSRDGMLGSSGNSGSIMGSKINSTNKGSKDHQNQTRDKVFVCSVCNRCFGYKHVLQNHERTHTGEKPFECKECHKRFTRDHHLKTHMRLHTGEKPYHCTHCERQFVQVANLRRHLRVHTGERPYACSLCTSRFSDSNQLKAHVLIHEGVKPFECQKCHGRFRRRHHLVHHKCPKDEANIGKPRRGRRPKAYDQLPTTLPLLSPVLQERLSAAIPEPPPPPPPPTIASVIANNSSPPPPQLPPAAHTGTMASVEKSRRKPLRTIRILTPQQQELFLREQETMQTGPLDMSLSSTPTNSVSVIVPRIASSASHYLTSPMEGVLDLSNSRSDSEAEPIEEEVDEADLEDDCMDDGMDSESEEDGLRMGLPINVCPWEDDDDLHPDLSNDVSRRHGNGERYDSEGESSSLALRLTTS